MPLNRTVTFQAPLRRKGRLQVPSIIRWQFKMETTETLKATIYLAHHIGAKAEFFTKMRKDGCITIPPVALTQLKGNQDTLEKQIVDMTLEPA